jgi:beta-mannosidase
VASESWIYRTQFYVPPIQNQSRAVLAFDGLDTFAVVRLDGRVILKSDNMFVSHRVDVTEALTSHGQHGLEIEFSSALLRSREIQRTRPEHKWVCWNGDSARLGVRKAQYHWGWDWGPLLMCTGIWKPIRLEVYAAMIHDVRTDVSLAPDYGIATVVVSTRIETTYINGLEARFEFSLDGKTISESSSPLSSEGYASVNIQIVNPSLWMPAGYGSQTLYDVRVTLFLGETSLHSDSRRIGVRRVELVQQPDRHGESFYFRINGIDIFCGGSCWIPADSFLTNVSQGRYQAWLELLVRGNQKMIRQVSLSSTALIF